MVRETRNKVAFSVSIPKWLYDLMEERRREMGLSRSSFVAWMLYNHFQREAEARKILKEVARELLKEAEASNEDDEAICEDF